MRFEGLTTVGAPGRRPLREIKSQGKGGRNRSRMPSDRPASGVYTSSYNFAPAVTGRLKLPRKIKIHDVTLRDGEQQARITFRKEEKVRIARALDEAGVDRIEAGMPSVARSDFDAIKEIAHLGLHAEVYAFSRCMRSEVDAALEAGVDGLIMEVPLSDRLVKYGYGWSEEKAIDLAVDATGYAHSHGLKVCFFTVDSTRAGFGEISKLTRRVATEGHMDSLVLADTFGVLKPEAVFYIVGRMRQMLRKPIEIHAHNDFGLGVANVIAAVKAGVKVAHVTVNGIGERTGNSSLEETVMALRCLYGVQTNVRPEKLKGLSELVSELSGVPVPPQKPIVGDDIFTIESGIIAGWWKRLEKRGMPLEMYPFLPATVGQGEVKVVLGKKSGKDSILYKSEKLGLKVDESRVADLLSRVKRLALEKKRPLTDEEFTTLVSESQNL